MMENGCWMNIQHQEKVSHNPWHDTWTLVYYTVSEDIVTLNATDKLDLQALVYIYSPRDPHNINITKANANKDFGTILTY